MNKNVEVELEGLILTKNSKTLEQKVEELVSEKDMSYIDAVVYITQEYDYDSVNFKKIITPNLQAKIEREAEELSLLKTKKNRLDV